MLVLTRKLGEKVVIGGKVTLTVVEVKGKYVRLAFDAPAHVRVLRGELIARQNRPEPDEELSDPDLAEKPAEWQEDTPAMATPPPAARRVDMEQHLPPQEPPFTGKANVPLLAEGLHILLMEADVRAAEGMAQVLRDCGHQVQIAWDVPSALQAAQRDEPDVVLLESHLPGMDTWAVAAKLREQATLRAPFCIGVAAGRAESIITLSAEAGVDLRLSRPVDFDFLRKVLRRFQRVIMPTNPSRDDELTDSPVRMACPALV